MVPVTPLVLVLSAAVTVFCWRRIWRSSDILFFKIAFSALAAVPVIGPFMYLFADVPPRRRRFPAKERRRPARPSAFLQRWQEREHVYLFWAGLVCLVLAFVAYWLNGWSPGRIHVAPFGWYTDADIVYQALLVLAVLVWGAALRAKVILVRSLARVTALDDFPTRGNRVSRPSHGPLG